VRLEPQVSWDVNVRTGIPGIVDRLDEIRQGTGVNVSLADTIVLAGSVGVEQAAAAAGHDLEVPFTPGRTDASQEMTEIDSFQYLEPTADGFRNYLQKPGDVPAEHLLVDKAFMLRLSAPEMTALVGGLRAIGATAGDEGHGLLTDRIGQLTNDFFVNLLDMGTEWSAIGEGEYLYEGKDRSTGEVQWTGTRVDLIFGANSQLRAIAEEYAAAGGEEVMLDRFVDAWVKVMENDRFDA
jgi:catalase-peroxidase